MKRYSSDNAIRGFRPPETDDPFHRGRSRLSLQQLSYWYPQSTVTDYATATIQITVPAVYGCIASGEQRVRFSADDSTGRGPRHRPRKVYVFAAERPLRYFAFLVAKLNRGRSMDGRVRRRCDRSMRSTKPATPVVDAEPYKKLDLIVEAHPRQANRGKERGRTRRRHRAVSTSR